MLRGRYLTFGTGIDLDVNRTVHAVAARLLERPLPGVTDVVPSYTKVYVEYDDELVGVAALRDWTDAVATAGGTAPERRLVTIPVDYRGPDLTEVASRTGLSESEVVARHSGRDYHVFALGFTPGFPYLGLVDPALRLPRRATPRARVDAHSVAIANEQTGVYPSASPGGWHLLGTALVALYDPQRPEPFLVRPGDGVRFAAAAPAAPPPAPEPLALLPSAPRRPMLEVIASGLLDVVVDRGRTMMGRFGLARSGPLDTWSAGQANHLIGNDAGAPLLELNMSGPTLLARAAGLAGFAGWGLQPLRNGRALDCVTVIEFSPGDVITFRPLPHGSRAYLALPGGIESARFWGSASVDLRAGLGRALASGDVLGAAAAADAALAGRVASAMVVSQGPDPAPLRIVPGPQATDDALAVLCERPFVVRGADRMGVRLAGASVPGGEVLSEATALGAIQVTPGGDPIVLLNDRGTLGGYAKPALVDPRDLPRLGQLLPGRSVRFHRTPRDSGA
jgi:KipI family sensor histidine kinase inhibitor